MMISDLVEKFSGREVVEPLDSTWAVTKKDIASRLPFSRWKSPDNIIHHHQWQLTDLAVEAANRLPQSSRARKLLDEALHSDQYWWASAKPWWSLEMMERGAFELKSVVLESPAATDIKKQKAEKLKKDIIYTGFKGRGGVLVMEMSGRKTKKLLK